MEQFLPQLPANGRANYDCELQTSLKKVTNYTENIHFYVKIMTGFVQTTLAPLTRQGLWGAVQKDPGFTPGNDEMHSMGVVNIHFRKICVAESLYLWWLLRTIPFCKGKSEIPGVGRAILV